MLQKKVGLPTNQVEFGEIKMLSCWRSFAEMGFETESFILDKVNVIVAVKVQPPCRIVAGGREAPGVWFSKSISGLIKIKPGRNPSTGDTFALRVYSLPRTINPACERRSAKLYTQASARTSLKFPCTNLQDLLWERRKKNSKLQLRECKINKNCHQCKL